MRVLFVARSADRRGDNQVLLTFLRWLPGQGIDPVVLLGADGPLRAEFERVAPTHVLPPRRAVTASSLARRAYAEVHRRRDDVAARRLRARIGAVDVVYVNSLGGGGPVAERVDELPGAPTVLHLHEQAVDLRHFDRIGVPVAGILARADVCILSSATGAAALREQYRVTDDRIVVIHPFLDTQRLARDDGDAPDLRELAGCAPGAFVVGAAGVTDWRKGPDAFLLVAREVARTHAADRIAFVWIGASPPRARDQLAHDRAALRVENVTFIDEQPDVTGLLRQFDVLCLPSREDPFARVSLECAALGVPSVRFRDAGGRPVFGVGGGAVIVDYLDAPAMATAVTALAADPERLRDLGRTAREEASEHDVRVAGPRVVDVLRTTVATSRSKR